MKAVFGDPDDIKETPGILAEFSRFETEMKRINATLEEIKGVISKVGWTIVGSVVVAVLALVIKIK